MFAAAITIVFLILAVVLFLWDRLPVSMVAMIICLGLLLFKVIDSRTAFAGFTNTALILTVGMFIIGGALFETGMANQIGALVHKFAKTERMMIMGVFIVGAFMSSVLGNTAVAAMLIPVIIGISAKTGYPRSRLLMPMSFSVGIGANMSVIGATGNMLAQAAMEKMGARYSFFEMAWVGLPLTILGILYFGMLGKKLLPAYKVRDTIFDETPDFSNVPNWKKKMSLVVLLVAIFGMIFEPQIGVPLHITSSVAAVFLVVVGVITEKQAMKSIDLTTVFLWGGTLSLAAAMEQTGAGMMIAESVIGALGPNASPLALLTGILLLAVVLTNFMSNTATTSLLIPIGVSLSQSIGADPRGVLVAIVIGSSLACSTPIGMPACTMVWGIGGYKFSDYVKVGLPLTILLIIASLILLPIFFPFFPGR
jgi:anion transporter